MALPTFVCHNLFQCFATKHVDLPHETKRLYTSDGQFDPESVRPFETVFVKTDLLDLFLSRFRGGIKVPFVLVTGHSDLSPSESAFMRIANDPGIVRWGAMNCPVETYKLACLPIGLSEPDRPIGDQVVVRRLAEAAAAMPAKKARVALPHFGGTHPLRSILARPEVQTHPAVEIVPKTSFEEYLAQVAECAYCICARGNAIDCHRVYECVLVRTVPIYIGDSVPAAYRRLPVIVLHPSSVDELVETLDDLPRAPAPSDPSWEQAIELLRAEDALTKWC